MIPVYGFNGLIPHTLKNVPPNGVLRFRLVGKIHQSAENIPKMGKNESLPLARRRRLGIHKRLAFSNDGLSLARHLKRQAYKNHAVRLARHV